MKLNKNFKKLEFLIWIFSSSVWKWDFLILSWINCIQFAKGFEPYLGNSMFSQYLRPGNNLLGKKKIKAISVSLSRASGELSSPLWKAETKDILLFIRHISTKINTWIWNEVLIVLSHKCLNSIQHSQL